MSLRIAKSWWVEYNSIVIQFNYRNAGFILCLLFQENIRHHRDRSFLELQDLRIELYDTYGVVF